MIVEMAGLQVMQALTTNNESTFPGLRQKHQNFLLHQSTVNYPLVCAILNNPAD